MGEPNFRAVLEPLRACLSEHPLYGRLHDATTLRAFMETHVFAVWDFQSLLKALQRCVTCVDVPWIPTSDPAARRLLNEIVLDEESDDSPYGGYLSHFELYVQAMREGGANVAPVQSFIEALRAGTPLEPALETALIPRGAAAFVRTTMAIVQSHAPHRIAAAFAYGREEIIPGMFRRLVSQLARISPQAWGTFAFYLERHIDTDAERHGPQSRDLVQRLCGNDDSKWSEALTTAQIALEARLKLWDDLVEALDQRAEEHPQSPGPL